MEEKGLDKDFRYKGLLNDIEALESYEAISKLTVPNLNEHQSKDLLLALAVKAFICMYDTGMGKTFMASAYMRALKNKNPKAKFLMFGTNNQLLQTCEKIEKTSGLKCVGYTESPRFTFTQQDLDNYDVIMLSHGCLNVPEHVTKLAFYLDQFDACVVDEMHLVSNFDNSRNAQMLQAILNNFEYKLGLTATPITTDTDQLAKALYMINPVVVDDWKVVAKDIKQYSSDSISGSLQYLFIVRQREENNHKGIPLWVTPMEHQLNADGQKMFEITKGPGATAQHNKVYETIVAENFKPGLIYANRRIVQSALYESLVEKGVKAVILNGATSKKNRQEIIEKFRAGFYDVMITNVTTALDLDCDWVMMYEFTSHVKQFIGRAERGFVSKELRVYFMFTRCTGEVDYFYRNVYEISLTIQKLLNVDFSEVISVGASGGSQWNRW